MPFYRVRTYPANVWPQVPLAPISQTWSVYQTLDRTQWLDPAEIEANQLGQLRSLLQHARDQVPYYGRLLADARIQPSDIRTMAEFRRLPLLSRQTLRDRIGDLTARALPQGSVRLGEISTSGSSGHPVTVHQTNRTTQMWLALMLRDFEWCGFDPLKTLASIRYTRTRGEQGARMRAGVKDAYWHRDMTQLVENGPCHTMDIHQEPREQLRWLREIQPDYLLSYPSNLEFLASLIGAGGKPIASLKGIQAISETLTDQARERMEAAFGVPVKNTYSCNEAGYLASPCPTGPGMHVHAENVILEVLDDAGQPSAPGEVGRVVLTALHNFQTPLIRYDILDRAVLDERCACGRGLPLLSSVQGKERPLFHLPDGRRKNSNRLALALRKVGGFHQFRIVQRTADHLVVLLVPDGTWSAEREAQYRKDVEAFFEGPVRMQVDLVDRLPLTPNGKSADMICEIPS